MALTLAEILAAVDLPREEVAVPEWGGSVWIRVLTGAERADFELANVRARKAAKDDDAWFRDYGVRLLALSLCDETGKPIASQGEASALAGKSSRVLDRLVDVAVRVNGLRASDVERDAGNSDGTPSAGPGSASPSP